jgi:hypothetical protein
MSIDTEAPTAAAPGAPPRPRRGRWIALGLVAALVLGVLVSAYTFRRTVTAERDSTFLAVIQAQSFTAFTLMQRIGYGQVPADAAAMSEAAGLELRYVEPGRSITVTTPKMRLEKGTPYVVLEAEMSNADLPGWVGDRYAYVSILMFGTYTDDANGVASDEGSCILRVGGRNEPLATGDRVALPGGGSGIPCTPEQLATFGIS